MFSRKKKDSPSTPAPASELTSSWVTQQLQIPSNSQSQSHSQSPQEKRRSQHVGPWSAHAPPPGKLPSPFLRNAYALSTSTTPTGELFLFGGYVHTSRYPSNELYMFSTQDFSTSLLQTSGDVPSPRFGHRTVLTSNTLLIWGGRTDFSDQNARFQSNDDSFYLLNLGTSNFLMSKPAPADQSFFAFQYRESGPAS
jgi:Galactose oxidase, central domain